LGSRDCLNLIMAGFVPAMMSLASIVLAPLAASAALLTALR
jgi:hypothetical protein